MIKRPMVNYARCGTKEDWEKYKSKYNDCSHVIPAEVYISKTGVCLVTSQEWCDWLWGKRADMPI